MWYILTLGFLVVSILVLSLLHRTAKLDRLPAYVSVLAFVAFFIPTSIVVLLPIDLASGYADDLQKGGNDVQPISYISHTILLKIWRASYWLSFSFTLTILPITQSFVESGYTDPFRKLIGSVRENLKYQAMYLAIGLFGILYILLNTKLSSFSDFRSLLIALANTWGLFLAINFLGHGLVNFPRRLWRSGDYRRQLQEIEVRAVHVNEQLEDASTEVDELAARVIALERSAQVDKEWLEEMAALIPAAVAKVRSSTRVGGRSGTGWFASSRERHDPATGDAQMAALMKQIRTNKRERYRAEWSRLVRTYTYLIDCTSRRADGRLIHRTFRTRLPPRLATLYYVHGLPLLYRAAAIAAGLLSLSILWAEILINAEDSSLRFVTLPITRWNVELFSGLLLAYMATCCYTTLLRLKIFDRYALLDDGHTSQSSLLFYASYLCRITIPLSYNFTTLLPSSHRDLSTFSRFLASAIDLSPLGTAFNAWFPLYILLPVCLTVFNSYDRLKAGLGIGRTWIDDDDDEEEESGGRNDGTRAEGRALLQREMSQRYGDSPGGARPDSPSPSSQQQQQRISSRIDDFGIEEEDDGNDRDEDDDDGDGEVAPFLRKSSAVVKHGWTALRGTFVDRFRRS